MTGMKSLFITELREKTKEIEKKGAIGTYSIEELVSKLHKPKLIWMMIPSGETVTKMIDSLIPLLSKDDILIDGGNSYYKDSVRRSDELKEVWNKLSGCRNQRRNLGT